MCLASSWELDPTSKHHLMRLLSKNNDIVWVNYHGSRRPRLSIKDVRWSLNALRRVKRGVQQINERMVQVTPLVLPGHGRFSSMVNRFLLTQRLRSVIANHKRYPNQPVQVWSFAPDVAHLAGAFDEEVFVYYCVDEFSEFEEFNDRAVISAERKLLNVTDVVLASSQRLYENRRDIHPCVHLVRHGVDHDHFAKAVKSNLPAPEPIRHLTGPIAGFIGLIHNWLDIEMMNRVAKAMPEVSFVFVGECQTNVSSLSSLENVYFIGRQPYETLPAYAAAFSVGLIPFQLTSMTANVNPIKLREYLAAGLPVVSTSLPEVISFAPNVLLADTAEDFVKACRSAIGSVTRETRVKRSNAVANQSWEAVVARVERLVHGAVEGLPVKNTATANKVVSTPMAVSGS